MIVVACNLYDIVRVPCSCHTESDTVGFMLIIVSDTWQNCVYYCLKFV